jgi:hypothetical protein
MQTSRCHFSFLTLIISSYTTLIIGIHALFWHNYGRRNYAGHYKVQIYIYRKGLSR